MKEIRDNDRENEEYAPAHRQADNVKECNYENW